MLLELILIAVGKESPVKSAKGATFDNYAITEPSGFIAIDGDGINHGYVTDQGLEEKIRELIFEEGYIGIRE